MNRDPITKLRSLAAEIGEEDLTGTDVTAWRERIADRLDRLIDQVVARPPLLSEIVGHAEAGGTVERVWPHSGQWHTADGTASAFAIWLSQHGDHLCHGYRLGPVPEPITERVRLDQVIGRRLPGERWPIDEVVGDPAAWGWKHHVGGGERTLPVDADGTVEVLIEGDQ